VNEKSIGVWFSLAILFFAFSLWLGYGAGSGMVQARNQPNLRSKSSPDGRGEAQIDTMSFALSKIYTLRFARSLGTQSPNDNLNYEISALRDMEVQPGTTALKSMIDLNIAIALLKMAKLEQQAGDPVKAHQNIESAKDLLRSLGWQDCSEETLNTVVRKEEARWNLKVSGEATQK
jgi:hypothetical protein